MREWKRINQTAPVREKRANDQPAWNRLLLDTPLQAQAFRDNTIVYPLMGQSVGGACIAHAVGGNASEKLKALRKLAGKS